MSDQGTSEPIDTNNLQTMPVSEFRTLGFVQEINRLLLHPCGLALSVNVHDDGTESFGAIWDYREDAEGITYGGDGPDARKAASVARLTKDHAAARIAAFGAVIQAVQAVGMTGDETNG